MSKQDSELAELQRQVQQLQLALTAAGAALWEWDFASDRLTWSPDMEALHGGSLSSGADAVEAYQQFVHEEDRAAVAGAARAARDGGADLNIRYRIVRSGEAVRWIEASGKTMRDAEGAPVRMIGVCVDVTTEQQLQAALHHERMQLRQIFEQAPAAITIMQGQEHTINFMNLQARRLVGRRAVIGRAIRDAFPELQGQGYFELLDNVYQTGLPFSGERMPARWDKYGTGEMVEAHFNIVYQPLRDHTGTIWGIMSHAVEISPLESAVA
jgi:PAS domain S-box-containing protein